MYLFVIAKQYSYNQQASHTSLLRFELQVGPIMAPILNVSAQDPVDVCEI